jgi:hypothetical protein
VGVVVVIVFIEIGFPQASPFYCVRLSKLSEIEGKLVKVNIGRNVADLAAIDSDLISQHARCRDLNGIGPIVIVIAESIGEVQNGILGYKRGIFCDIEMSWLHCTLSD